MDLPHVPTRAQHALEAGNELRRALEGASEALQRLAARYREAIIETRVHARRHERHLARIEYARAVCAGVAEDLGLCASAVAALALLGAGGPDDEGGDGGGSTLPLLPESRIWRHKRRVGGAWVAALRAVAGTTFRFRVALDYEGDLCLGVEGDDPDGGWDCWLMTASPDGSLAGPVAEDLQVARAVRRALVRGRTVDGRDVAVQVKLDGPRELAWEIALAAVEAAIAKHVEDAAAAERAAAEAAKEASA
jgi:hypothetical protein